MNHMRWFAPCTRRRLLALPALALASGPLRAIAQPAEPPLRMSLAPFLSPAALLTAFRPLREHLHRTLGRPVEMFTARDFRTQFASVQRQEMELALLPAHLAALAVADLRWRPTARTLQRSEVLVIVRDDGSVPAAAALRGRRVGTLDRLSLTATVCALWLHAQGLDEPNDVAIQSLPSINSALLGLQQGEVDAVVAARSQLILLPPDGLRGTRTLAQLMDIPGPFVVAQPATNDVVLARWREALQAYEPDPARPPSAANTRLTPLLPADLLPLQAYADRAREALAVAR